MIRTCPSFTLGYTSYSDTSVVKFLLYFFQCTNLTVRWFCFVSPLPGSLKFTSFVNLDEFSFSGDTMYRRRTIKVQRWMEEADEQATLKGYVLYVDVYVR